MPRVLVACEFSGVVRDAFAARGWDAWSCDLRESERPGQHHVGDARGLLGQDWDLLIAHPPCTYLTLSGVRWLYEEWTLKERREHYRLTGERLTGHSLRRRERRWDLMLAGADFFTALWTADIPHIAVENPQMHRYAMEATGGTATQFVQPYHFGTPEAKRTGLRLKNLPPLRPVPGWQKVRAHGRSLPKETFERVLHMGPSVHRKSDRSRTFPCIAQAMADQWGPFVERRMEAA